MDCGYRRDGYFDVCATERGLTAAWAEAELIRPYGYTAGLIDPGELRSIEPALAGTITGAVHYPQAATLDPFRFVRGLAAACVRRGVTIREGVEVADLATASGCVTGVRLAGGAVEAADAVVLATGPFSLRLGRRAGVRLPVQPGKGYHRDIAIGPAGAPPLRIACVLHESSVFCTPLGDRVRLAGTMEFSGMNLVLRPARLEQLIRAARSAFPGLGDAAPLSDWCGLRPVSADGLPVVGSFGAVRGRGAWVATGHGMLGLTLGPVTGELIADALLHDSQSPHLLALSPDRFHGKS